MSSIRLQPIQSVTFLRLCAHKIASLLLGLNEPHSFPFGLFNDTDESHIEIEEDRRHRRQERSRSLSRMRLLGFFLSFPSWNLWTPFSDDMFRLNLPGAVDFFSPLCSPRAAIRRSSPSQSLNHQ